MDAIYARQSVDKKDSISIEGQIDLCKKECGDSFRIYKDRGYSGKNTERPDFQKMMKAVQCGEIDKIVVYRLDRISRSITDFGCIWHTIEEHAAQFVSVNEKFDTSTPVGRAMVYIIMVFAQLERETIAERIKDNYYQRARRGAYLGGPAPFGFRVTHTEIGGKSASMLVPDENIETVKQIFKRYAYSDDSLGKIAAKLAENGVQGMGRKTWDNVSVARILHNPSYVQADADVYFYYRQKGAVMYNEVDEFTGEHGLWLFGKREGGKAKYTDLHDQLIAVAHHPGIVDSKTFLMCQTKMERNRQIKNTGSGKYSWLSGLLKCGYCGYSMRVIHARGDYLYFSCSGKSNLHVCKAKHIRPHVSIIEENVEKQIAGHIEHLQTMKLNESVPEPGENEEKIELIKIDAQISHLIDALSGANTVSIHYINDRLAKLDRQKNALIRRISVSRPCTAGLRGVDFHSLPFEEKKKIAYAMIEKVAITNEEISVFWRY